MTMSSEFDRLMSMGDDRYFEVFKEHCSTYTEPTGIAQPVSVDASLSRDAQVAGADGMFMTVQYLVELRLCQVRKPRKGGRLKLPDGEFLLEERIDADGLVERWSLIPRR